MTTIKIKRTVQYDEEVYLRVPNATSVKDFMEAIMQNKEHYTTPIPMITKSGKQEVIKTPEIFTYYFGDITEDKLKEFT